MKPDHDEGTDMPTMRGDGYGRGGGRRSSKWLDRRDLDGFVHRACLKAEGFSEPIFDGRPVIGICNSWSELNNCNVHLRRGGGREARRVERGRLPPRVPGDLARRVLMKPTTMLFRNLMAMDVEECIRAYPLDAVVLLSGCDKTTPAMLMGAASADVPAIMVTGGPMLRGNWRGQELGSGTDLAPVGASRRADHRRGLWPRRNACRARAATAW